MFRFALFFAASTLATSASAAPSVVTDTPVVHSLVAQVMDGVGTPQLLLDKGADPHDFQLRPSQAAALDGADLVVWIGPEMTPWLARAAKTDQALTLLDVPDTTIMTFEEGAEGHDHDHADEAGGRDPHAWLDPANAAVWLGAIADALVEADPQNAATYEKNAAEARDRIAVLDAQLADRLQPLRGKAIGVYHEAYGYFADHYGLTIAGSLASGDAHDPGAGHLSELQAELSRAICVFPEAGHDGKGIETLATDTGIRVGPALDPEGLALDPGPDLYGRLLSSLADGMLSCLKAP